MASSEQTAAWNRLNRLLLSVRDFQQALSAASDTGIPMSQVSVQERGAATPPPIPPAAPPAVLETPGMRKAVIPLNEGDVTLTFPGSLSPESFDLLSSYLDLFFRKEKRATTMGRENFEKAAQTLYPDWEKRGLPNG